MNCKNCNKEFTPKSWNAKFCCTKCRQHYLSAQNYKKIGKEKNAEIAREYRKKLREKRLKESLSKKRNITTPEGVSYEKPFEKDPTGNGYIGVILCDKDSGEIQCHECGGWFHWLQNHIRAAHKMSADQYREKHGLGYQTALCSEKVRDSLVKRAMTFPWERLHKQGQHLTWMAKNGKTHKRKRDYTKGMYTAEYANKKGTCHLQLFQKMVDLSEKLGRQPYTHEFKHRGAIVKKFGSMAKMRELLEMQGYKYKSIYETNKITREQMIESLIKFAEVYKRKPSYSDIKRGVLFDGGVYAKEFGSWSKAKMEAYAGKII